MNYEQTDVIFVVEKSISLKIYLNELLENYIAPALSIFSNGISEENDVFFTQSSSVQYAVVFFGSEFALNGSSLQMETHGPTTSQVSILNAIKDANYSYRNTCRQAYILEALETATEVFKDLSGPNLQDSVRRCLILVTQSSPIQNIWATSTPENIIQEMKKLGIKTSIISAHKLVELYRLYESTGGDQPNLPLKNYSSKPQHLVLLNGFTLQERALSPSLIIQTTANVPTPPQIGMPNSASGPSSNPALNMPIPSPGQIGSPLPSQQQPSQMNMVRPSVSMNQLPVSPAMPTPQGTNMRVAPQIQNNLIMTNQNPNVAMNPRQRWTPGNGQGMMVPTNQAGQQQLQPQQTQHMQQQPQQNQVQNQMQGNMQQISCGMANQQVGQINQQQQLPMNPTRPTSPTIIWQGTLEWSEKTGPQSGGTNFIQRIPCKISSQQMNGKIDIKTDGWPSTLQMLLVQKNLLSSVGNTYFQNIHKVMFYPDPCPALESLTASLSQGYAGCVHLSSSSSEVKMIILLFSPEKRAYVGFIPLDQNAFVAKIKEVFQSQSRNMQSQTMNKQNVGGMMQQRVGGPQIGVAGSSVPQPQNTGMQMMPNTPNINVAQQPNIIMQQQQQQQQQQMNPVMSQGGNPMMSAQVSQVGSSQVNQMGTGAQGQAIGVGQSSAMNMGSHVPQGGPMGNQIGQNQTVMGNKMIRPTMNITGQQQPTDQMQMRQSMHSTNIRQQIQLQQRPNMQVNLGGQQPRMMQSQMRQLLQQQRLQQQQQQQQMLMLQQQNMRPQMPQSQQVMGQQVMGQQNMGQQGMQQGMGPQGMGQQSMGQGMGQPMQDNATDYMDLL